MSDGAEKVYYVRDKQLLILILYKNYIIKKQSGIHRNQLDILSSGYTGGTRKLVCLEESISYTERCLQEFF